DENFPQLQLAKEQMTGACGLLTFIMRTEHVETIETFCNALKHVLMAVSWGGHESLIIPRCAGIKRENFIAASLEHRMLRLYVGLEDADYIIRDLRQAFEKVKAME
ncbi:MAG TPA: PLP-dependent transferase, partial [Panacibacter sp.]|nr:PLP-dependent transferase [Panacibacter sp.]